MKELEIPPAAQEDPKSVEILRLWIAKGGEWVSLNPYQYRNRDFEEEWAWGLVLSDAIKHIANAVSELSGKDKQRVIDDIRTSFEAEMDKPTSEVRGGILQSDPENE
jgi:hypothetical protein